MWTPARCATTSASTPSAATGACARRPVHRTGHATRGKDENGVGYVKGNALAGREFPSWEALHAHLLWWLREVADVRIHGTTGEPPIARFRAAEAAALKPLAGKPPFVQDRELRRRVHSDACVEVDTNRYSVPWKWIGHQVRVLVTGRQVRVYHRSRCWPCMPKAAAGASAASSASTSRASSVLGPSAKRRPRLYPRPHRRRPPASCSVL